MLKIWAPPAVPPFPFSPQIFPCFSPALGNSAMNQCTPERHWQLISSLMERGGYQNLSWFRGPIYSGHPHPLYCYPFVVLRYPAISHHIPPGPRSPYRFRPLPCNSSCPAHFLVKIKICKSINFFGGWNAVATWTRTNSRLSDCTDPHLFASNTLSLIHYYPFPFSKPLLSFPFTPIQKPFDLFAEKTDLWIFLSEKYYFLDPLLLISGISKLTINHFIGLKFGK